jgi:mono/diheme cytochrome c family protein
MRFKVLLMIALVGLINCSNESNKQDSSKSTFTVVRKDVEMQLTYCYSCHNPNAASHDDLLAPPFVAVKQRYLMSYPEKDAFVNAVSAFAGNPQKEKALMRGALNQYGMMAKAPFTEEQLKQVATYLFENELEKPDWFDEHEKQMHGSGGPSQGRGMGMNAPKPDSTSNN